MVKPGENNIKSAPAFLDSLITSSKLSSLSSKNGIIGMKYVPA